MKEEIAAIRREYSKQTLSEEDVAPDAIEQFTRWWNDAIKSEVIEVNAMTLATATNDGKPHARIVLLKGFDDKGFVFFTNYESHKGKELAENPKAALVFMWKELERQVRIEGTVTKIDTAESDAYFQSRPAGSRIGAWVSPQSKVIASRELLEENVKKFTTTFGEHIPRPANWGGYLVIPASIEFWQGRRNRLHDRILYTKTINGDWKIERLAP
jgi:pyridoxamine 5'-phosphate oxidase